jgi:hypothetical protein
MTQYSKIVKGKSNAVVINFAGIDLTSFVKVEAIFGNDVRDSVNNPESVQVVSQTELRLYFGDTSETSGNYWTINGYNATGLPLELTSKRLDNLEPTEVV